MTRKYGQSVGCPGIADFRGLCCKGSPPVAGRILEGSNGYGWMGMMGSQGSHLSGGPQVISWNEICEDWTEQTGVGGRGLRVWI